MPAVHHYLTKMRPDGSGRDLHSAGNSCGNKYTNPRRIDLASPKPPHSPNVLHMGARRIFGRSDPPPHYLADGTGRDTFLAPVSEAAARKEEQEMSGRHFFVRRVEHSSLRDLLLDARQYGVSGMGVSRPRSAPLSPGARAAQHRSIMRLSSPKASTLRRKFDSNALGHCGAANSSTFRGRGLGNSF